MNVAGIYGEDDLPADDDLPVDDVAGIGHCLMTDTDNGWLYLETGKNLATQFQFFLCAS